MWSAKVVRIVYGLRWQVELMFKNWQSLLNIHILKGTRPERIKCILYGRLMTITMMTLIASYASWYAEDYLHRELSMPKLINWLKRQGRFAHAMHVGTLGDLFNALRQFSRRCCVNKKENVEQVANYLRTMGTTWRALSQPKVMIIGQIAYLDANGGSPPEAGLLA